MYTVWCRIISGEPTMNLTGAANAIEFTGPEAILSGYQIKSSQYLILYNRSISIKQNI